MLKRDVESLNIEDFDDRYVRHAFISKVFAIIAAQLALTLAVLFAFVYIDAIQDFVVQNPSLMWVALAAVLVTMLPIACCEGVRRSYPINFILLILFTMAESFLLGCIAIRYAPDTVLYSIGITTIVVLALTIFALQTSIDFTACWAFLLVASIILLIIGIVAMFFPSRVLIIVYCSLGILIFSIYLIFDIQLMMGGKHKFAISPEDYIFAALSIYIDIITIFIYILTLMGFVDN
ncbi:PREDICTED: protein lifeguard 1-like [Rhagoletis zephyria]|uniref:protein lifeguard 1-like n=1 Tax=Rhagoletis zephyria TaxID=28612 RepID=UPI0008116505|nr:PREDICTED: protein lifeguard 1-like [Rhagoletis zephyria]